MKDLRSTLRVVVLVVAIVGAGIIASHANQTTSANSDGVLGDHSISSITKRYNAEGMVAEVEVSLRSTRHDGSTIVTSDHTSFMLDDHPTTWKRGEILDLTRGREVKFWPEAEVKQSWSLKDSTIERARSFHDRDCVSWLEQQGFERIEDGPESILGYPVLGLTRTRTGASRGESMTLEKWVAPQLHCAELKARSIKSTADGRTLTNETNATMVTTDRLSDQVLEMADGYREILPSQLPGILAELGGPGCSECAKANLLLADERIKQYQAEGR